MGKYYSGFLIFVLLFCFSKPGISIGSNKFEDISDYQGDTLSTSPVFIPEIKGTFEFDGVVDDPCWETLTPLPMVMHIPTFGIEPSEVSEVFICHDNLYIYIGGRFYDSEADKINITSKMRDNIGPQEDGFLVIFDTFHDHENAVGFRTNAAGVRQDLTISNDSNNPFPWNETWNTFWDVKSTKNERGWFTEMRIPLSSLRFKEKDGKVEMGFSCNRFIPRKFELDVFPAIPRKWGFWSFVKPSQANVVVMEDVHSKKPFYIAPYVSGGLNKESILNEAGSGYEMHNEPKLTAGLDIKYGITSNLTADITFNTDFAQVESDNARINLTRFSLFFPEKRMFFQERSSNFAFAFDDMNTLFYSRKIGLHEGQPLPIIGGVRLVGRAGPWDIGVLDMETQKFKSTYTGGISLPSENFGVLRFRRQVLNQNSYVGTILTSRLGTDGTYNEVIGFDGIIRVFGDEYLNVKYAQSFDEKYKNKIISPDASRIWFDWQRRNEKGLGYDFFYSRAGANFEPDLGFEFRRNYYTLSTKLKYGIIAAENSIVSRHTIMLNGQAWKDISTNLTQSGLINTVYSLQLKSGASTILGLSHAYENLTDTFHLSNDAVIAYIKPGQYGYNFATINLSTSPTNNFGVDLLSNIGQYYDGNQFTTRIMSTIKFGSFLSLEPSYEYDRIRFPSRNQLFDGHIGGLKMLIMLNKKLSISSLIQYSNIDHGIVTNVRLRFNPSEGNDFYFVFNEGRNIQINREYPVLNPVANRGVLVKYTYTFIL